MLLKTIPCSDQVLYLCSHKSQVTCQMSHFTWYLSLMPTASATSKHWKSRILARKFSPKEVLRVREVFFNYTFIHIFGIVVLPPLPWSWFLTWSEHSIVLSNINLIFDIMEFWHFGIIRFKSKHHGRAKLARKLWHVLMPSFDLKMPKSQKCQIVKKEAKTRKWLKAKYKTLFFLLQKFLMLLSKFEPI